MKGKIVLVPFPFDDLSGAKVRPALCLADSVSVYDHIITFISQVQKATEDSDLAILQADPHFSQTGLKVDSAVRLHRVVTIPGSLIQKQLGVLPSSVQSTLDQKLRDLFEL